ncbi:MAG: hypothetical protein AAGF11_31170 [Myxococcota bacterium]
MESLSNDAVEALKSYRARLDSTPGVETRTWARIEATRGSADAESIVSHYDAMTRPTPRRWPWVAVAAAAAIVFVGLGFALGRGSSWLSETESDPSQQSIYEAEPEQTSPRSVTSKQAVGSISIAEPEPEPAPEPAVEAEPEPDPIIDADAARPRPRRRSRSPASSASDLAAEIDLLRRAKQALGRGSSAEALAILEQHRRRFPRGQMAPDRHALQLEARCHQGSAHRAKARRFLERHPRSPYAARLRKTCDLSP